MNKSHDLLWPNDLRGLSNIRTSHPRAKLHFARGSDAMWVNFRLAQGPGIPRVAFRIARGASAPQWVSTSLDVRTT
jgi:hypothetical protein